MNKESRLICYLSAWLCLFTRAVYDDFITNLILSCIVVFIHMVAILGNRIGSDWYMPILGFHLIKITSICVCGIYGIEGGTIRPLNDGLNIIAHIMCDNLVIAMFSMIPDKIAEERKREELAIVGWRPGLSELENGDSCVICLEDFVVAEKVAHLDCDHVFHGECISKWFWENKVCPMCRSF